MSRAGGWSELRPLPSRLWIRWAPLEWPAPEAPATDLTRAGLTVAGGSSAPLPAAPPPLPEVVYFPPVPSVHEAERGELARRALAAGHAVIWQRPPDGPPAPPGACDVVDLLPVLLAGAWPAAEAWRGVRLALWPLLGGPAGEELVEFATGVEELQRAGVPALLGLPLDLDPGERRALADRGGERMFDRLFHGVAPEPRALARLARRRGLEWGLARPEVGVPPTVARNRAAAAQLARAAELWSAAGRAEGTGAEIWRAAREAEGFDRDLAALAREGRLGLLPWLAGPARGVVEAWAAGRPAELLAQLEEEWLAEKETAG